MPHVTKNAGEASRPRARRTGGSPALLFLFLALLLPCPAGAQRQMEHLGRGVLAVRQNSTQVYVGWRLLGNDPDEIAFNLYRSAGGAAAVKLNPSPLNATCNYLDTPPGFALPLSYFVRPVLDGVELPPSAAFTLPAGAPVRQYLPIPLQRPSGGTTPDGINYTYNANDCSVGDLDGDGEYEIIVKWDPSNAKDNSQSGYTGNVHLDAYKLDGTRLWRIDLGRNIRAGAHYTQFMVYDLDGNGRAEIACKTAPGTVDGLGNPVLMPGDNPDADYRNSNGYILSGPEYLTIFDGLTGAALATTNYLPARGNVSSWGDNYGNRVDRFLAAVAFLDGVRPSLVMCRGYYTRSVLVAWDWRGGQLTHRWTFDSTTPGNGAYARQGAHSLTVGDVDGDGRDEIIYGACTIDHDGTGLYSTGLGHGDALHLSNMDPRRPGQEIWMIHETPSLYGPYGLELHDAATGEIIFGVDGQGADVGRGVAFDIDPRFPGYECWGSRGGLHNADGTLISSSRPSQMNFGIWWDADPLRELLDGTTISKWNWLASTATTLLSPGGVASNNGSKATPGLSADLLGDWREEVIWRSSDNLELRIYTTTIPATNRFRTFMHDPQYRLAIAWQNAGYNQPPHPGFYVGADMPTPPLPPMSDAQLVWRGGLSGNVWDGTTANWRTNRVWTGANPATVFQPGVSVLFDLTGTNTVPVNLAAAMAPGNVTVHSPTDYVFDGTGSITGTNGLIKAGVGVLTIDNTNTYGGTTLVNEGTLLVNGSLPQSPILVQGLGRLGGSGHLGQGVTVEAWGGIAPGGVSSAGTLAISNALVQLGGVFNDFDLSNDPAGISRSNDLIQVAGDLTLLGTNVLRIHLLDGTLSPGTYSLIEYTGAFNGGLSNLTVEGLAGVPYTLTHSPGQIGLHVANMRAPSSIVWAGGNENLWDLLASSNWWNNGVLDHFVSGDTVRFDNSGAANSTVNLAGLVTPASVTVDATANYTFAGSGGIGDHSAGATSLVKTNSGTLTITAGASTYTGPTLVAGGILSIEHIAEGGAPSSIGASGSHPGNLRLQGGTLRYQGVSASTDRGATLLAGAGVIDVIFNRTLAMNGTFTGPGQLHKTGAGTLALGGSSSYTGGTMILGGTVQLASPSANGSGLGTGPVTLANGRILSLFASASGDSSAGGPFVNPLNVPADTSGSLYTPFRFTVNNILTGAGTLNVRVTGVRCNFSGNWSAFTGRINVSSRTGTSDFRVNNTAGFPNARLHLNQNVLMYSRASSGAVIPIGEFSGHSSAVVSAGFGSSEGTQSAVTWRVGGRNTDATNASRFQGNLSLIKEGSGSWTLAGTNSYTGTTTVNGGVLHISGDQSAASGAVTVATGATLGGSGVIGGNAIVSGFLAPGEGARTLTFNGNLTLAAASTTRIELSRLPLTNDLVRVLGSLSLDGTLAVTNVSETAFTAGDTFRILDAANSSGAFSSFDLPSPGPGLAWNTARLASEGLISVESIAPPQFHGIAISGANVVVSGGGGPGNGTYSVLTSTNPALPLADWTGTSASQFDADGNFIFTNAINPNLPQQFFLLQLP